MGLIEEKDVRYLVQDEELIGEIVNALVAEPAVIRELAEDVASELGDLIEDDQTFGKKLIAAATSAPEFKKTVIRALTKEFAD